MRYALYVAAAAAAVISAPAQAQYTSQEVASTTVTNQANGLIFGDDTTDTVGLGFNFNFYGNSYSSAFVSSNGFLSFTSDDQGCCIGEDPGNDPSSPNNLVAGYWVDLYPPSNQGVTYGTTGAAGSRVFTVAYNGIPYFANVGSSATFSISLFEGSNNILLNYNSLGQIGNPNYIVTGGIEDITGTDGLGIFYGSAASVGPQFSNRAFLIGENLGAVPEPATWALLILGFGLLGGAMRRKAAVRVAYA